MKTGQRKLTKGGTKPLKALRELITNIQKLGTGPREPDLGALTDRLSKHVQQISAQAERMFHAGLRTAAAEAGVEVGRCGDRLSIGPFALLINMENESASIEYAKLAVETGLPLDPQSLVASIATHAASLLNKPDDLPGLSAEVQEAIRVTLARQTRLITSAELRAELPSVFREMTFIRQSRRSAGRKGATTLSLPRFVVEIAHSVKSDFNISSPQPLRLETAVIENAGNPKKSLFVPNDLSRGYGEGMYFQAIVPPKDVACSCTRKVFAMQPISQRDAKAVIRSLGTSGQPPKFGARLINVGTEQFLRHLEEEYLKDHCLPIDGRDGGGTCKWVEADYGNGKTQFLRCLQELAWDHNYVTAYVELSQDECPLDRPERVFSAVTRSLQAKPDNLADLDRSHGFDTVLTQLFDRKLEGVLSGVPNEGLKARALEWLKGLQATPVESTALGTAAVRLLAALLNGDEDAARISRLYLRGESIGTPELKKIGVYEKLDKASGFRLMRSMTQLIQRSGLALGVVLLFDEARRTLSLMSSKQKAVACENLLNVVN